MSAGDALGGTEVNMPKRTAHMVLGMPIHAVGYHPACWLVPGVPPDGAMSLRHAVNCAVIAERGKLDFVFLADTGAVRNLDNPAIAREREHEHVKFEPISLLAALATATTDIGLVGTVSTTYNQPYHLARALASLDHISKGRAGWNLVTGFAIDEARNFGADAIAPSPMRHARAREFVQVLRGLFAGGDLDHHGAFFDVRGKLDVARPPQDHMAIVTAGYSEEANAFTAEVADMVYAAAPTIAVARDYYADLKNRLPLHGRTPDQLKVLPGIMPFIGRTQMEAEDKFAKLQSMIDPPVGLGMLALWNFPDLRGYDLDGPVPEVAVTAGRYASFSAGLLERVKREKPTIRQLYEIVAAGFWQFGCIGTPVTIADAMEEWFTTEAADGFNIQTPYLPGCAEDFVDLVIPELQRRGLFRGDYKNGETLQQRLGLGAKAAA
jgi:alkanesulfonate monooxygenase SsuD/methylene tetrahydromethanopterin reductase-like flavin-dependent oxidoreductase (luciferase family)